MRRHGFTLIELLLVLSVVLILVALTVGSLGRHLRRSAVDGAAGVIVAAADQARQMAMLDNGRGTRHVGVRIEDPGAPQAVRVCIVGLEDGRLVDIPGADGRPLFDQLLPASAIVWLGDTDLASAGGSLEWFYENGSGRVHSRSGGGLSAGTVSVGLEEIRLDRVWGRDANQGPITVLAPASASGRPGLSIRSTDNVYAVAVGVHSHGLAFRRQWQQEDRR